MKRFLCAVAILSLCVSCVAEVQADGPAGSRRGNRGNFRGFRGRGGGTTIIMPSALYGQQQFVQPVYQQQLGFADDCGCGAAGFSGGYGVSGFSQFNGGLGFQQQPIIIQQRGFGRRGFGRRGFGGGFGGFGNRSGFSLGGALLGGFGGFGF